MSTAKFRNNISNYKRLFPSRAYFVSGLRNYPGSKTPELEDGFILEMINNIDFVLLYKSIEFRSKLRERLKYYNVKVEH